MQETPEDKIDIRGVDRDIPGVFCALGGSGAWGSSCRSFVCGVVIFHPHPQAVSWAWCPGHPLLVMLLSVNIFFN